MDLSTLLSLAQSSGMLNTASEKAGVAPDALSKIVQMAAPVLMQGLAKNASTPEGATSLSNALQKHDGSLLDNVGTILGSAETMQDGSKILGHVLGGQTSTVTTQIAEKAGVSPTQTADVMSMLAPLVMGMVGKEVAAKGVDASGLSTLLSSATTGMDMKGMALNMLTSSLDQNKDGSVVDDVLKMGMDFLKDKKSTG